MFGSVVEYQVHDPKLAQLLGELGVTVAELVHTTGRIQQFLLSSVVRVRVRRYFHLYQWVFRAINIQHFFGWCAAADEGYVACAHIFESTNTVVAGVNFVFHRF